MTDAFARIARYVTGGAEPEKTDPAQLLDEAVEHQRVAENAAFAPGGLLAAQLAANKLALYALYRRVEYGD